MFSSIYVSVLGAVDTLKGYVAAKWLDFRGWFKPRFASCKETVRARTERARLAVKDGYDRARVAAAPAVAFTFDYSRQARVRILALAPLLRDGLALVVGLPITFLGTQVLMGAAQAIGVAVIKLALVDVLLGLLPSRSRTDLRRNLRGAVAAGLLGIALAGATIAHAIDPRPAATDVEPVSTGSATSPVVAARGTVAAFEPEAPAPARPAERRTRRRVAGSNGRA